MSKKHQKEIKRITDTIVKKYKPEKIILFGSYAWGKPTKDSDMDLFIIKNTKKDPFRRIPEVRSYLFNIDRAFDILVMTPEEVKKRLEMGDFFIEDIVNEDRVLYEGKKL